MRQAKVHQIQATRFLQRQTFSCLELPSNSHLRTYHDRRLVHKNLTFKTNSNATVQDQRIDRSRQTQRARQTDLRTKAPSAANLCGHVRFAHKRAAGELPTHNPRVSKCTTEKPLDMTTRRDQPTTGHRADGFTRDTYGQPRSSSFQTKRQIFVWPPNTTDHGTYRRHPRRGLAAVPVHPPGEPRRTTFQ